MKKLIVISIIISCFIALSIFEIIRSTNVFSSLANDITILRESVSANENFVDNEQTISLSNKVMDRWNSEKRFLLVFNNHATVRSLDEKIVAMHSSVENGKFNESMEYSATALSLCNDLIDETHPIVANLF